MQLRSFPGTGPEQHQHHHSQHRWRTNPGCHIPALEASATHSISGTVTLDPAIDDETVLVAAKQALNGGPTVTVKSQVATVKVATVSPGDYEYSLALPIGAPSLGRTPHPCQSCLSSNLQQWQGIIQSRLPRLVTQPSHLSLLWIFPVGM